MYINSKISLCSCTPIILTEISECYLQVGKGTEDPYYWLVLLEGGLHFAQIIALAVLVLEVGTHLYHQAYAGEASGWCSKAWENVT